MEKKRVSSDNISVITIPVVDATIQSAVVCDGHGQLGSGIARWITQEFDKDLNIRINQKQYAKPHASSHSQAAILEAGTETILAQQEQITPSHSQAARSESETTFTQLFIITITIAILQHIVNYFYPTRSDKLVEQCSSSTISASSEPIASVENQTEIISALKEIFTKQLKNESLKTIVPKMQKISTESLSSHSSTHWSKHTFEKHDCATDASSEKVVDRNVCFSPEALDATKQEIYLEVLKVIPIITEIQYKINRLRSDIINNKDLKGGWFKRCWHNRAKTTLNHALTQLEGLFTYQHIQNKDFDTKINQHLENALKTYEETLKKLNSKRNLQALQDIKSTFERCDLCLMSEINGNKLESNKLYLIIQDNQIKYRTNLTKGSDYILLGGEISQPNGELYRAINEKNLVGVSESCKKAVLNITSKRGHTPFESEQFQQEVNTSSEQTFTKIKSAMYPKESYCLTANSRMYTQQSKDARTEANRPSISLTL